jgi:hypothetical protein
MTLEKGQLQGLFLRACTWQERIRKTTGSDSVVFQQHPSAEFSITAFWSTRAGEKKQYTKLFTEDFVFGPLTHRRNPPRVLRTLCTYLREFMQEVIANRGL